MHILTSAALKASSFSESFLLLFFLFFFFISIVLRSSSSSSSSRGCWCFSLVVSLLFRRVFTIACISVLRKSRTLLKREKKRVSQKFSLLSFFLSLETRANASAVWWVKQSPNTGTPLIRNPGPCNLGFDYLGF